MTQTDRFPFIESPNDDFPYYKGQPVAVSGRQWLFVLGMLVLGFASLMLPVPFFRTGVGQLVPAFLFLGFPLLGLAIVTRGRWAALFRPVGFRDVLWMVGFGLLNIVVSFAVGLLVIQVHGATANPVVAGLSQLSREALGLKLLETLPQLLGEEVLTVLPFLACLYLLHTRLGWSRMRAVVGAWVMSALVFGALHLPTYGWNWVQCLVIIGSARLVLTLAYIKTKNIWVSTGAHICSDWSYFAIALLGARGAAG
ncbi:MAG: CPBP family intramembrane glutamic endopeptidase [Polaromonas sp.]|uniref:CPBP family intramembrane glutamic endopeptidase n=1 Tax=Polaromonas sp. TaxID=1869339 RepID=UPI00403687D7